MSDIIIDQDGTPMIQLSYDNPEFITKNDLVSEFVALNYRLPTDYELREIIRELGGINNE